MERPQALPASRRPVSHAGDRDAETSRTSRKVASLLRVAGFYAHAGEAISPIPNGVLRERRPGREHRARHVCRDGADVDALMARAAWAARIGGALMADVCAAAGMAHAGHADYASRGRALAGYFCTKPDLGWPAVRENTNNRPNLSTA